MMEHISLNRVSYSTRLYLLRLAILFGVLFFYKPGLGVAQNAPRDPKNVQGGFFDRGFATEDLLDDPDRVAKPQSTPEPTQTTAPKVSDPVTPAASLKPTVSPQNPSGDSSNEFLSIVDQTKSTIEQLKSGQGKKLDFQGTIENTKQSIQNRNSVTNSKSTSAPELSSIYSRSKDIETNPENESPAVSEESTSEDVVLPYSYSAKTSIGVVVATEPRGTMLRVLDKLMHAKEKLGLALGPVLLVGDPKEFILDLCMSPQFVNGMKESVRREILSPEQARGVLEKVNSAIPTSVLIFDKLKLQKQDKFFPAEKFLNLYEIKGSPTWIVYQGDRQYLFEGQYDLYELFDAAGQFTPPQDGSALASVGPDGAELVRFEPRPGSAFPRPARGQTAVAGTLFLPEQQRPIPETEYVLPEIPRCESNDLRRNEVGPSNASAGLSIDILLYSADDPEQRAQAKRWKKTSIAYRQGERLEEVAREQPLMQFISTLSVRCLPTRYHILNEGTRQYCEYREGANAWIDPVAAPKAN